MVIIRILLRIIEGILFVPAFILTGLYTVINYKPIDFILEDYWDWINDLNEISDLKINSNLKQMKIKYLFQALKFACLPTLSILVLLFCGFFSISKTIDFISSDSGWAIALRVLLVIAEIVLIIVMYLQYEKEGIFEEGGSRRKNGYTISSGRSVSDLGAGWRYNDIFKSYSTSNDNIIIIERTPNSNN